MAYFLPTIPPPTTTDMHTLYLFHYIILCLSNWALTLTLTLTLCTWNLQSYQYHYRTRPETIAESAAAGWIVGRSLDHMLAVGARLRVSPSLPHWALTFTLCPCSANANTNTITTPDLKQLLNRLLLLDGLLDVRSIIC